MDSAHLALIIIKHRWGRWRNTYLTTSHHDPPHVLAPFALQLPHLLRRAHRLHLFVILSFRVCFLRRREVDLELRVQLVKREFRVLELGCGSRTRRNYRLKRFKLVLEKN